MSAVLTPITGIRERRFGGPGPQNLTLSAGPAGTRVSLSGEKPNRRPLRLQADPAAYNNRGTP